LRGENERGIRLVKRRSVDRRVAPALYRAWLSSTPTAKQSRAASAALCARSRAAWKNAHRSRTPHRHISSLAASTSWRAK